MKLILLALAGLVAAGPLHDMEQDLHAHHHVKVTRYAAPGCVEGSKFDGVDEVKDGECENYDNDEPGFLSFKAKITYNKKKKLGSSEECRLYAYDQKHCKGNKQAMDDMHTYDGKCQSQGKIFGRSLKLKCMKKSDLSVADDFDVTRPKTGGVPGWTSTPTTRIEVVQTVVMPPPGSILTLRQSPVVANPKVTVTAPGAADSVVALTVPVPGPKTVVTVLPNPTSLERFMTITTVMAASDYSALVAMAQATAVATVHVGRKE